MSPLALLAPLLTAAAFAICEGALHLRERMGGPRTNLTRGIACLLFLAAGWCASRDWWGLGMGFTLAVGIWTEQVHGEGQGAETASDESYLLASGWSRLAPAMLLAIAHAVEAPGWWTIGGVAALMVVATMKPPLWWNARIGGGRFWDAVGWIAKATDFDPAGGKNEATRRACIVFGALIGLAVMA